MKDYSKDLTLYRLQKAARTLGVSKHLIDTKDYTDSVNRSYYSAFYAVNAVHSLSGAGYRRHKDAIANFNKTYVYTGLVDRSVGRDLASLERARNFGDYDDFQLTSRSDAQLNYDRAVRIVTASCVYCKSKGVELYSVEAAFYLDFDDLHKFLDITPPSLLRTVNVEDLVVEYLRNITGGINK